MNAVDLHHMVETLFNDGDADGLSELYEPDAMLMADGGSSVSGTEAIRGAWAAFTQLGGSMKLKTLSAVDVGDLALLSNVWTFEMGGAVVASATTAEVARRQPDGSWRYVIDNPYAGPPPAL